MEKQEIELLQKYRETKKQLEALEENFSKIREAVVSVVKNHGGEVVLDNFVFKSSFYAHYQYRESIVDLEKQLKKMKRDAVKDGSAVLTRKTEFVRVSDSFLMPEGENAQKHTLNR